MCHVTRNDTPASVEATPVIGSKLTPSRISRFRRIRVNLNKYWGLLSQKQKPEVSSAMQFDHAEEMEQNKINEMLEALANAEEQNSINFQISESSSPEQPPRMVRQRALLSTSYSSCNSFSSYGSSAMVSQESLYY